MGLSNEEYTRLKKRLFFKRKIGETIKIQGIISTHNQKDGFDRICVYNPSYDGKIVAFHMWISTETGSGVREGDLVSFTGKVYKYQYPNKDKKGKAIPGPWKTKYSVNAVNNFIIEEKLYAQRNNLTENS